MSGKPKKIHAVDLKNIIEIKLQNGETQKEIAKDFGVAPQTIQYYRRKFGFKKLKAVKYNTPCSIVGCNSKVHGLGLCNRHYKRMINNGSPLSLRIRKAGMGTPHISGYWVHKINGKSILRHILVAEKALGKSLPVGAEVHHVDLDRSNDNPSNLVICQNRAYHKLLHKRTEALRRSKNVLSSSSNNI